MKREVKISFDPVGTIDNRNLTYVVMGARENSKWIFVRHRDRISWELPAGHIEPGELPDEAAQRELYEETGTTEARLEPLSDYTVTINGKPSHGRIYYAAVEKRDLLPEMEIAEIVLREKSPSRATYPEAHEKFLELLERYIDK